MWASASQDWSRSSWTIQAGVCELHFLAECNNTFVLSKRKTRQERGLTHIRSCGRPYNPPPVHRGVDHLLVVAGTLCLGGFVPATLRRCFRWDPEPNASADLRSALVCLGELRQPPDRSQVACGGSTMLPPLQTLDDHPWGAARRSWAFRHHQPSYGLWSRSYQALQPVIIRL
jgi:hypothetical protein